ncbi:MAG TPA: FAD-dependent oxidoreductase, partial [Candidatus Latescibacteria bacterium]|nr:FAD-dependent oxidoreductase [Candidatus Latescibacterota bacterium]
MPYKGDKTLETLSFDLAVIGAGPAGQKGAIQGAKAGKSVAIIDRLGMLGGSCLHQGTIPSKALRMAILDLSGFLQSVYFGNETQQSKQEISMQDLQARLNKVIGDEDAVLKKQCEANGVQIVYGSARFADEHLIEVSNIDGEVTHQIVAAHTLIGTGSRPRHPIDIPSDDRVFMDSDEIFRMKRLPDKMIVVGCG